MYMYMYIYIHIYIYIYICVCVYVCMFGLTLNPNFDELDPSQIQLASYLPTCLPTKR